MWGVAGLVMVLWRDWGSALASSAREGGGRDRVKGDEEGVCGGGGGGVGIGVG